ncbi:MAG: thiamine pyrophosphate-binding protein [Chloroflexi bacterium]|nr:thiamine pyrophosphate-binding protein [Chloroflexota bacterium]
MGNSGARLLVEALKANGAKYILGIGGWQTLPVLDILYDDPSIKFISVRHEQAAPFASIGYARAAGEPCVCFSIPGPGATNMVTGVASAYEDSMPVVVLAAQIPLSYMSRASVHRCDLETIFRPITKEVILCRQVRDIPGAVNRAFRVATSGRRGPAAVLIPTDLFPTCDETPLLPTVKEEWRPDRGLEARIEEAARMLEKSAAPCLFAGGGVVAARATKEMRDLAEKLSAPVFTSRSGRGTIPEDHPLAAGTFAFGGAAEVLAKTDACLAIGTRFSESSTLTWTVRLPPDLIEVNISPEAVGQVHNPKLTLIGDAKYILSKLNEKLSPKKGNGPLAETLARVKRWRSQQTEEFMRGQPSFPLHPRWMVRTLRDLLPHDARVICDATSSFTWFYEHDFTVYEPDTLLISFGYGSMGYAFPCAMGMKLAKPDLKLVSIVGDGSFLMQMAELATCAANNLSVPIIVMNDGYYGVLRRIQLYEYRQRFIGTDLNNPDFVMLAKSFGAAGYRLEKPADLTEMVQAAFANRGPTVIDVPVDGKQITRLSRSKWIRAGYIPAEEQPYCEKM